MIEIIPFYCGWRRGKRTFSKTLPNIKKRHSFCIFVNPFQATDLFWYPIEHIRKPEVFWCFQRVSKEITDIKCAKFIEIICGVVLYRKPAVCFWKFSGDSKTSSWHYFSFYFPWLVPVVVTQASVSFLISDEMMCYRIGHKTYLSNLDGVFSNLDGHQPRWGLKKTLECGLDFRMKTLCMVTTAGFGKMFCNLRRSHTALLVLLDTI